VHRVREVTRAHDKHSMVSRSLHPGFVYGKVDPKDFALVKSRTQIPRQDRTLRKLPSVAIYPTETSSEPIAWGFLGLDASLTTLHVEPAYRGLGLAKSLSLKLFSEDMGTYCQHDPTFTEATHVMGSYAHADVAVDNKSSQGVCEGLGGKWYFEVFWIRVDLLA
jgi:ribosomal protein S18 acetylase RimI-like enzyme